jgi:hypothetical protein
MKQLSRAGVSQVFAFGFSLILLALPTQDKDIVL